MIMSVELTAGASSQLARLRSMVMAGSCEARALRAFIEVLTPGMMIPPRNTRFSSITPMVVAVPKSMTMAGTP